MTTPSAYLHFSEPDNSISFIDESGKIWTGSGNAKILNGSLSLDGTSWISTPQSSDFSFSDDFTISFWVNSAQSSVYFLCDTGFTTSGWGIVYINNTTPATMLFIVSNTPLFATSWTSTLDQWYHIAYVRHGTSFTFYINGVATDNITYGSSITPTNNLYVGADTIGSIPFIGNIDDFQIIQSALWTSNFTPPSRTTSSFGAELHFTEPDNSTTFIDESGKIWTPNANAKITNAALSVNSNGQISTPQSADFSFLGDFTIDFWIKFIQFDIVHHGYYLCDAGGLSTGGWCIVYDSSTSPGTMNFVISNSGTFSGLLSTSWDLTLGRWYHIAFTRVGDSMVFYVDGSAINNITYGTAINITQNLYVGADAGTIDGFIGSIDDFRISQKALWTSAFTPTPRTAPTSGLYPYTIVVT